MKLHSLLEDRLRLTSHVEMRERPGNFEVQLTFRPEDFESLFGGGSAASDPNMPSLFMPSLFSAVEEQLGLRLNAAVTPHEASSVALSPA